MVAVKSKAKRKPSCPKWTILLLAAAAAAVPLLSISIFFVPVAQPVSVFEQLESISSLRQTTAENLKLPSLSKSHSPRPAYHVIFSTGCSQSQNWQSYFFFYHALAVQQPGNVTRIASGCSAQETVELHHFHERYIARMSKHFLLHFTPDYSELRRWDGNGDNSYK
jgi:hypothetical protein